MIGAVQLPAYSSMAQSTAQKPAAERPDVTSKDLVQALQPMAAGGGPGQAKTAAEQAKINQAGTAASSSSQ